MFEEYWPILTVAVAYFISSGFFLWLVKENELGAVVSWIAVVFIISIYLDLWFLIYITGMLISFIITSYTSYMYFSSIMKDSDDARDYAAITGMVAAGIVVVASGFHARLPLISYMVIGFLLFIVSLVIFNIMRD